ncbi:ABC branched chain amino acid transporter ATP-binding subunit (plasmid) [Rhodococcus jostii RHA1]|uniref:ABC branched chain amino acid transporter ATP-binding subunit n=1 Tax=Rhodococcus jostii (strain RHA1) TaxID=101510 RepID=Q0RW24_RHOJR|nr:ATP-binding cassette domain-containing protein [Rhodococcus jostii]ABH00512.1 ABC branched chain amino acid transporter ATP-binding subunit [Rhodococcus jostii RHA1]
MLQYLPLILSGIATGAIFGLAGTGLVLTFKTSGLFNFGHGAIATVAAYVFYSLHVQLGLGALPSFVIAVLFVGPVLGLIMERVAARLAPQPVALQIVGTVGIMLAVQGLATLLYGPATIRVDQFLPFGTDTFSLGGVVLTWDFVIITGITLVAVGGLYALFRFSRTGLAMRAVVDDPNLVSMLGTNPTRVRRTAWVIGSTFTALSGVLVAPVIGLDAIGMTFLVVQAFGAAVVGAFSNIPRTLIGGLVIGVLADLSKAWVLDAPWLAGVPATLPFLVLFIGLLVLPKGRLPVPDRMQLRPPLPQFRALGRIRIAVAVLVLIPLLLVPSFAGTTLSFWSTAIATAIMVLSLGLLVRTSGQVSLCHAAFAAIGAVAFAQLSEGLGLPWIVALLVGALVVVPVGALVAIPAIRLSGLYLALATFGFGIMVQQLLYGQPWMFTSLSEGRRMPRPEFATSQADFYYVLLAALVIVAILVVVIVRSRLGRVLQGMSESPMAVTALGLSSTVTKLIVFCISAYLAGIGGALLGMVRHFAIGSDPFYLPFSSLLLLTMLALAPFAEPWYALVALTTVLPAYLPGDQTVYIVNAVFGVFGVMVAMQGGPPRMPIRLQHLLDRLGGRQPDVPEAAQGESTDGLRATGSAVETVETAVRGGLEVADLHVRFGGLVAVDGATFRVPTGTITGLIGPNGAGKTTTFDACSGLNRRFSGAIRLHGDDITRSSPAVRGRAGLGRTFQRMQLCETLTVMENVVLGRECSQAGKGFVSHLVARPSEWRLARSAARAAVVECGIEHLADRQVATLSTGQRRLVELARCLAGPFDVLLLDEPSSGLDATETARLAEVLERVVARRRIGILLVEHDVELVMRICSAIFVLDFGRMIFDGTPLDVAASELVRAAYLGDDLDLAGSVGGAA